MISTPKKEHKHKPRLNNVGDKLDIPKVVSPRHQTAIYSSENGTPKASHNELTSSEMQINENDIINYLKNHFNNASNLNKVKSEEQLKKTKKEKSELEISSLPCSESESPSQIMLPMDKYHENRMPNCLSSFGDMSPRDDSIEKINDINELIETYEKNSHHMKRANKDAIIAKHICPQIYKAAQNMIKDSPEGKSGQANFISQCALQIMKIVSTATHMDKSLDTLQLEHEEKEIQNKLNAIGESFISESDIFQEQYQTPSYKDTVVVKQGIKDQATIKNLKKQFVYNQPIVVTQRTEGAQSNKNEVKTTAASSKRKQPEDYVPIENAIKSANSISKPSKVTQIETSMTKRIMHIDKNEVHIPMSNKNKHFNFDDVSKTEDEKSNKISPRPK